MDRQILRASLLREVWVSVFIDHSLLGKKDRDSHREANNPFRIAKR
jgi:hypothetical protein